MTKIKVFLLGDNGSPHIQKWVKAVSSYPEIDLNVVSIRKGVHYENVTYHYLRAFTGSKLDYLLNVFKVKQLIKKHRPQLVHSHYATSYGFLGAFSSFHPFIITGWGADIFDSPKNPLLKYLLKYSFRKADAISVLTEVTRVEIGKLTNKEVSLIPFGVDLNKFKPDSEPHQLNNSIVRIGTIRLLKEKYGVEYLIRAFANAEKKFPNIHLDIIGDGDLKSYLEKLSDELGIRDKVTFYGYVNQNEEGEKYMSILQKMDIFAILSILDSETFGVAGVEASACGIPVVASNVGGLPEVIDDNVTGILVEAKNVEQTQAALEKLIADKNLRTQIGNNGRLKVEKLYNWKKNADQMIDLYKSVIKNVKS